MFASRNMIFSVNGGGAAAPPPPVEGASLTFTWQDNSAIETGFRVRYRLSSTGPAGAYTLATTTTTNTETATITGLEYGTSYDVTVASYNGAGEYAVLGPYARYTPPEFGPTSLALTTANPTSVVLSFTPPAAAPTGYQSYYRPNGGSTWTAGATSASSPITVTGLTASTDYEFMVRGYMTNPAIEGGAQTPSYSPDSNVLDASTAALVVGWEVKVDIASTGDTSITTEGTLIEAKNLGDGSYSTKTVNTVPFTGITSRNDLSSAYGTGSFYGGGNVGSDFEYILDSVCYGGSTISFASLTIGCYYLLQLVVSDERGSGEAASSFAPAIAGFSLSGVTRGPGSTVICRFVATSGTMVLSNIGQLNAFQLRQLPTP